MVLSFVLGHDLFHRRLMQFRRLLRENKMLKLSRQRFRRSRGVIGPELLFGGATAMVCGAVWAIIAIWANAEIGWVAWGVGGVVGLVVVSTAKKASAANGVSAAGLAAVGLLLGKFLIVQWGAPAGIASDVLANDEEFRKVVVWYSAKNGNIQGEAMPETPAEDAPDEQWDQWGREVAQLIEAKLPLLTTDEKGNIAHSYAKAVLASYSVQEKIRSQLSFFDLLWFGLAVFTAWKIGSGSSASET